MIQKLYCHFKSFFSNPKNNFENPLSVAEFQELEIYAMNYLDKNQFHSHGNQICKSINLDYKATYERYYITFQHNQPHVDQCKIPVFYCHSCKHYHALLIHLLIVPHCVYSLSFILCVLFDKLVVELTVEAIVDKYNISPSTLYRWESRYHCYLVMYRQLRNKYTAPFFNTLLDQFEEVLNDLFDISGKALFQYDRNFCHPPSS